MPLSDRVRRLNDRPLRPGARYVLYWCQMNRRAHANHALAHAVDLANQLGLPVLFYEGLTCSYPYANRRLHTFLLEAVPETARAVRALGVGYLFHLRRRRADPDDIVYRLAREAAALITDDYPTFVAARHNPSVAAKLDIACFAVDSSTVVPMRVFDKREYAAYTIRPKIRRLLPQYLRPLETPRIAHRWRGLVPGFHTEVTPPEIPALVASCEIDHSVPPSLSFRGGRSPAEARLSCFLENNLRRYARLSREPSAHATSNLSPYLHVGQISSLEVALATRDYAESNQLHDHEFLEQLIVRRELAFNHACHSADPAGFGNLPQWAREELRRHAADPRPVTYTPAAFEAAETHDELWNATQEELRLRGTIHGYYRMYWGKKIIEWSRSFEEARDTMVMLHDKWALDGRDPNTYTNILWCFGLHDRPWPERPVLGKLRALSLEGMKRKTAVADYLSEIASLERTGHDPFSLTISPE